MIRYLTFIFSFISALTVLGQQEGITSQYMLNPIALNPAYTGHFRTLTANALYRFQSVGLEGAPQTQTFAIHSPLQQDYAAVGLQIARQSIATSSQLSALFSTAYRIKIADFTLSAGLQLGLRVAESDFLALTSRQDNDPTFSQNTRTVLPNFGSGIYIHNDRIFAGISIPEMARFKNSDNVSFNRPIILMGGYVMDINPDIKFKPSGLVRMVDNRIVEFNVNASFVFKDVVMAGLAYRPNNAFIGLLQLYLTNQLQIGYTYDVVINDLAPVTSGSHEIGIQYLFRFSKKDVVSPRYF